MHPPLLGPMGVLRADIGHAQPCRGARRSEDLAVFVLEEEGISALENAGAPVDHAGRVTPREPFARALNADQLNGLVGSKFGEESRGESATAHRRDQILGSTSDTLDLHA